MSNLFFRRISFVGFLMGLVSVSAPAKAVPLEIGPMGGWRFGGSFEDSLGNNYTAEPTGSWGGTLDVFVRPDYAVEFLFSRQETTINGGGSQSPRIGVTLDHYQIGGLKEYAGERFRPFLAGLLGWSHVSSESDSTDRFSMTMAGGAKLYMTPRVGLRSDLRCHLLFGQSGVASASSGPNGGSISFAGDVFIQGEVALGLFLAFGGERDTMATPSPVDEMRRRKSVPIE